MTAKKSVATKTGTIRFRTTILQAGKSATGIQIPDDVMAKLGTSKKPPVRVTLNGYTYRSTQWQLWAASSWSGSAQPYERQRRWPGVTS